MRSLWNKSGKWTWSCLLSYHFYSERLGPASREIVPLEICKASRTRFLLETSGLQRDRYDFSCPPKPIGFHPSGRRFWRVFLPSSLTKNRLSAIASRIAAIGLC